MNKLEVTPDELRGLVEAQRKLHLERVSDEPLTPNAPTVSDECAALGWAALEFWTNAATETDPVVADAEAAFAEYFYLRYSSCA